MDGTTAHVQQEALAELRALAHGRSSASAPPRKKKPVAGAGGNGGGQNQTGDAEPVDAAEVAGLVQQYLEQTCEAGNDALLGGAGDDTLRGGAEADTAVYVGKRGDYSVAWNADGTLRVEDTVGGTGRDGTDTLTGIEYLRFADGTFQLGPPDLPAELSVGGKQPVALPNGETRSFVEDGDCVILRGWCEKELAPKIPALDEISDFDIDPMFSKRN